jgi:hypothetical protein
MGQTWLREYAQAVVIADFVFVAAIRIFEFQASRDGQLSLRDGQLNLRVLFSSVTSLPQVEEYGGRVSSVGLDNTKSYLRSSAIFLFNIAYFINTLLSILWSG